MAQKQFDVLTKHAQGAPHGPPHKHDIPDNMDLESPNEQQGPRPTSCMNQTMRWRGPAPAGAANTLPRAVIRKFGSPLLRMPPVMPSCPPQPQPTFTWAAPPRARPWPLPVHLPIPLPLAALIPLLWLRSSSPRAAFFPRHSPEIQLPVHRGPLVLPCLHRSW